MTVAHEMVQQMKELEEHLPIRVRFCSYEDDAKQRCLYCHKDRKDPLGYLCETCLQRKHPWGGSLAESYSFPDVGHEPDGAHNAHSYEPEA